MPIRSCVYSKDSDFILFFLFKLILFFTFAAKDSDNWNQKSTFSIFDFNLIFLRYQKPVGRNVNSVHTNLKSK